MGHSERAKVNMTNQLKAQLGFLHKDLEYEKASLAKALTYVKWNLPGVKSMINRHQTGVDKTLKDIATLKIRIKRREENGECFTIL